MIPAKKRLTAMAARTEQVTPFLAVEVFGNPCGMDELEKVARAHEVPLVEDCCEALGGRLGERPVGMYQGKPNQRTRRLVVEEGGMRIRTRRKK